MGAIASDRVLHDAFASDLAFHAGQELETLLLDRGAEIARCSGSSIVRAEHVLAAMDESIMDQLRIQLNERVKRDSRKAA